MNKFISIKTPAGIATIEIAEISVIYDIFESQVKSVVSLKSGFRIESTESTSEITERLNDRI